MARFNYPEQFGGQPSQIVLRTGQTVYLNPYSGEYTSRRDYGLRMQRGFARGISQSSARSHGRVGDRSESQIRREREANRYGPETTPTQRFNFGFQQRYGFSYSYWRRLRRLWIGEINARSLPNPHSNNMILNASGSRADPRVFPSDITAVKNLYDGGFRDPVYPDAITWQQWIELRLSERLYGMREFQDMHNKQPGNAAYTARQNTWTSINMFGGSSGPPIELWWYH